MLYCLSIMSERIVYVIQEIPGTKIGNPKINIMVASKFGKFKFLLPEDSQIIFSPGPLIYRLRPLLKNFTKEKLRLLKKVIGQKNIYLQLSR